MKITAFTPRYALRTVLVIADVRPLSGGHLWLTT
jgi:hypothetical protein